MRRCEVRWAPVKHRNLHSEKDDHGLLLLLSVWKWRIRCPKSKPVKDFSKLTETKTDSEGKQIPNEVLIEFDKAVKSKLREQRCPHDADAATLYTAMNAAIQHAVDTVIPDVVRTPGISRKVSAHTKALYDKRERMRGCKQPGRIRRSTATNSRISTAGFSIMG